MNIRIVSSPVALVSLTSLGCTLSFVSIACLAGCSKPNADEQSKMENQLAAAFASAMASASAAPGGPASGNAPTGAPGAIQSTCTHKADASCTEHMGAEGFDPAQTCKGLAGDGVYAKGSAPCPRDNLMGTCTRTDAASNLNDIDYHYKQAGGATAADLKSICDIQSGVWAAAPAASGGKGKGKK